MTIHEQLKKADAVLDSHESDLYVQEPVKGSPIWAIVASVEFVKVSRFRSPIDGKVWLCIPFANNDWWIKRARRSDLYWS